MNGEREHERSRQEISEKRNGRNNNCSNIERFSPGGGNLITERLTYIEEKKNQQLTKILLRFWWS